MAYGIESGDRTRIRMSPGEMQVLIDQGLVDQSIALEHNAIVTGRGQGLHGYEFDLPVEHASTMIAMLMKADLDFHFYD